MKRILLDTYAWSLATCRQHALPLEIRNLIAHAREVSISTITIYEIGQNVRLGKWPEMEPYTDNLIEYAKNDNCNMLPVTPAIALSASLLAWQHRDPFGRIIAATAINNELALVSSDREFDSLSGIERIAF